MSVLTINTAGQSGFRSAFDRFKAGVSRGFVAYIERQSRMDQVNRLNAKTDVELAEMGLRRDDIPRYVFRDLIHI